MRSRQYEIPLHTDDMRKKIGSNPTVTVYADRSVELAPAAWAADLTHPTRTDAVKILRLARGMGYDIERRYL